MFRWLSPGQTIVQPFRDFMLLPGLTIQHHLAEKVNKVRPLALLEKDQNAMSKILYVLCMNKIKYPPLLKLVSKCSSRSASLKLEKISCAKKMDGSSLPPCSPVNLQKPRRTNYVCSIWLNAHEASPPNVLPSECGWVVLDDCYRLKWYDGEASPTTVEDICRDDSENDIWCSALKGWLLKAKVVAGGL